MLLIHTNTHHTHLQSYTHQSSRSGAGHKRAVLSVGCVVRKRGCRPPRSEAAAASGRNLQQLRWPPPSLVLSPTLPAHARNEKISGVTCTDAHVASTCHGRARERGRAEQDQMSPARPWSASWWDSFRVGPKPSQAKRERGQMDPLDTRGAWAAHAIGQQTSGDMSTEAEGS